MAPGRNRALHIHMCILTSTSVLFDARQSLAMGEEGLAMRLVEAGSLGLLQWHVCCEFLVFKSVILDTHNTLDTNSCRKCKPQQKKVKCV